jgi:hypothetical protein
VNQPGNTAAARECVAEIATFSLVRAGIVPRENAAINGVRGRSSRHAVRNERCYAPIRTRVEPWSPESMEIHFVSSLTPEDEDRFARAVLSAAVALLGPCALTYTLRIRTSGVKLFHHHHADDSRPTESPTQGRQRTSEDSLGLAPLVARSRSRE